MERRTGDFCTKARCPPCTRETSSPATASWGSRAAAAWASSTARSQLDLDRTVALKLIAPQLAEDPDFRERFVRESRAAASIDHPNVIPIYYAGESDDGALYIAMRYVEGSDLRTLVRAEGRLDPARAAHIVAQVARRAGRRARARHRAPRRQARQRPARRRRPRLPHRLRPDQARDLAHRLDARRRLGRHARLRRARADPRRAPRRPRRRLRAGLRALPRAHRRAALPARQRRGDAVGAPQRRPAALPTARRACPRASTRVVARAMAKDPDDRFPSAGDLGRAALAAAGRSPRRRARARRRPRRGRARRRQETVASPDRAPTTAVSAPASRRLARRPVAPWALAAVPSSALAVRRRRSPSAAATTAAAHGATTASTHDHAPGRRAKPASPPRRRRRAPDDSYRRRRPVWVTRSGNERLAVIDAKTIKRARGAPQRRRPRRRRRRGFGELWVVNQTAPSLMPIGLTSHRRRAGDPAAGRAGGRRRHRQPRRVGRRPRQPRARCCASTRTTHARRPRASSCPTACRTSPSATAPSGSSRGARNTVTRLDIRTGASARSTSASKPADVAVRRGRGLGHQRGDDTVTRIDTRHR